MKEYVHKVSECVWGKVNECELSFPDICFVSGRAQEGYAIPKDYSGTF